MKLTIETLKKLIKEELNLLENDDGSNLAYSLMDKVEKYDGVNMSREEANAAWEQVQEMASQGSQSGIDLDDMAQLRKKVKEWDFFEKYGKPVRKYLQYYNESKEDAIYDIAEGTMNVLMFTVRDLIQQNFGIKNAQEFDEKIDEEVFSATYSNLISSLEEVILEHSNIPLLSNFFSMHFFNMVHKYFMIEIQQNISKKPYSVIEEYAKMPYLFMKDLIYGDIKNDQGVSVTAQQLKGKNGKQTLSNVNPLFEMWRALKGI
jgi:hypothetical protein